MPDYVLSLLALAAGGALGSYLSIALADRATKLPPRMAGYLGLAIWFVVSSAGVWLWYAQVDNILASQHARNVGAMIAFVAIWMALSVIGTLLGGVLAVIIGQRRRSTG